MMQAITAMGRILLNSELNVKAYIPSISNRCIICIHFKLIYSVITGYKSDILKCMNEFDANRMNAI